MLKKGHVETVCFDRLRKEASAKKDKSPANRVEDRKRRESDCSPLGCSQTPGPDRSCKVQVNTPEEKERNKAMQSSSTATSRLRRLQVTMGRLRSSQKVAERTALLDTGCSRTLISESSGWI